MAGLKQGNKRKVTYIDGRKVTIKTHKLLRTNLTKEEEFVLAQELHHDPEYAKLSVGGCCAKLNRKNIFKTRAQRLLKRPLIIEGVDIRYIYERLFNEKYTAKNIKAS
jgi:hypothetical protein